MNAPSLFENNYCAVIYIFLGEFIIALGAAPTWGSRRGISPDLAHISRDFDIQWPFELLITTINSNYVRQCQCVRGIMGATMAQARCRRLPDRPPTTRISNKFEDKGSFVRELFRRIKTTFIMVAIVALGSWFIQTQHCNSRF